VTQIHQCEVRDALYFPFPKDSKTHSPFYSIIIFRGKAMYCCSLPERKRLSRHADRFGEFSRYLKYFVFTQIAMLSARISEYLEVVTRRILNDILCREHADVYGEL
jgi:hypothetical protein